MPNDKSKFLLFSLILLFLPWLAYQPFMRMPGDAAWLLTAAQHILAGHAMTTHFFDSNPPMSYIIYIPAALLTQLGITAWSAVNIYTFVLIGVSALLIFKILQRWKGLDKEAALVLLVSWLAAVTICSQSEFGQKDHFIAITLLPFLLAQYAMTEKQPNDGITKTAIILGVPFILIKPHFGLLAVANLAYRFYRERRSSIIFDFDFVCLAAGVITYVAAVYFYFPDFLSLALPFTIAFYVSGSFVPVNACLIGGALLCACLGVVSYFSPSNKAMKFFLCVMGFLAVFAFWAQNKGFSTQLLPALSLLIPAIALQYDVFNRKRAAGATFAVILLAYAVFGFRIQTHDDYRASSFAQLVREYAQDDSYFIEVTSTSTAYTISLYEGIPIASRFPSLWFMPRLIEQRDTEDGKRYKKITGDMIAEDFATRKPKLVLAYADRSSFYEFFADNPEFQEEWRHYRKQGRQYTLDQSQYSTFAPKYEIPTATYDIFVRE
jgi:hypothetical protein